MHFQLACFLFNSVVNFGIPGESLSAGYGSDIFVVLLGVPKFQFLKSVLFHD